MAESTKYSTQQRCVNLLTLFTFQSNQVLNTKLMHSKEVSVVGEDKRGLAPCISPLSSSAQMLIIGTVLILINQTHTSYKLWQTQNVVFIAFVAKDVLIYGDLAMIRLLYVIQQVLPRVKELVPLKQVVKLRRDLSANDTSRHPKLLKIGPNHQCQ